MTYRLSTLILFMFGSTLLSVIAAQAHQTMPSLLAQKSVLSRSAAKLLHRRNRSKAGRIQFFYPAPSASEINELATGAGIKFQVDPQLVEAIIRVESAYNTNAVSGKGARGLMQLIPETARRFGAKNLFNPSENISAGVGYLKHLLQLFSGDVLLAVAAYNAGENAVIRRGGIPAYPETVDYVRRVATLYKPGLLASVILPMPTGMLMRANHDFALAG